MVNLFRNLRCLLWLPLVVSCGLQYGRAQTMGYGESWIRSHPFQIMALSSDTFNNWDAAEYAAAGMNTTLDWEKSLSMLSESAAQGLPWFYNLQEDPNQLLNPSTVTPALQSEIQGAYNTDPNGNHGWLVYDEVVRLKMSAARTVMDWIKGQYPNALVFSNARPYGDTPDSYWGPVGDPNIPAGYGWETYLADHANLLQPHVFMDDFEDSTDAGYSPGALLQNQNGWNVTPGPIVPLGAANPDFSGQFLDGPAAANGPSATFYTNSAGMTEGLDPNGVYSLSWDWKLDSTSHNQTFGFVGDGFAPGEVRNVAWYALDDAGKVQLLFEPDGTQQVIDVPMTFPFADPKEFTIVVDGVANELYGTIDGVETARWTITDAQIADLQMLQLFTDNGPSRRFPQTDNVRLEATLPGPPSAVDVMTIAGSLDLQNSAVLEIQFAGTQPGEFDALDVGTTATLDGTLEIETIPGFTPVVGGTPGTFGADFTIVTAASISGTFAVVNGNHVGSGMFYLVEYNPTNVMLRSFQALAGDADGDKDVDITDFNTLSANFDPAAVNAATNGWETADFDEDGDVDITDFNNLSANFVPSGYAPSGSQVPEPSGLSLIFTAILFVTCLRLGRIHHC